MNYKSHPKMKYLYIGIDCHKYTHTATMINCFNEELASITFNNDKKGYESLITKVEETKENLIPIFGLEDTNHLGYGLSEFLLNRNYQVKHINSHLTSQERKKFPTITKNDKLDSECIAKVLLDYLDSLQDAENNEIYWTLKQVIKMRKSIVKNNIELKNKLHAQLLHHYPNYNQIFEDIGKETALIFFENYPSPNLLNNITLEELEEILHTKTRTKHYKNLAQKIINLISEYDIETTNYQTERNNIIKILVNQLKTNQKRLEEIEKDIASIYEKIGAKLHTIPCISTIMAASLISEIGNINRFQNSSKLARYAGIAPIERSSGGKEFDMKSNFGNRTLNSLFYLVACNGLTTGRKSGDNKMVYNPIFEEYYQKKISEGKTKHQAIICIMRRLNNIVYKILKENIEYQTPIELEEKCKNSFRERNKLKEEKVKQKEKLKENRMKEKNQQN